ncbi:helix-turn-helix domain-containing protein, partial [Longibacter sp.]|uniref:helix-turn-helix domain-containing protein n=1 Tax=Longibacter sp. TaxID=2045415 RepID=UPI003EBF644D
MKPTETTFDGPYDSAFDVIKDKERAASMKIRSKLAVRLTAHIKEEGYTQSVAAEELKVDQSRISRLLNGRISGFTIDALIDMCHHAGINVDVIFDEEDGL